MMWMTVVLLTGCREDVRVDELERELAATQQELRSMKLQLQKLSAQEPETVQPAPGPKAESLTPLPSAGIELARRRSIENDIGAITETVDRDLGLLEDDVDTQATLLDELDDAVAELSLIVNNHADLLDGIGQQLLTIEADTQLVRDLDGTLTVDEGRVRIVDADLVLVQGKDADGTAKPNGQIFQQPAMLREPADR